MNNLEYQYVDSFHLINQIIKYIQTNRQMFKNCSFCLEPSIIHCMNRSVHHKHNEEQDKSGTIIDQLLSREKSSYIKYVQKIIQSDERQCLLQYSKGDPCRQQLEHLKQYYKFRIYVPLFTRSRPSDTVLNYYYKKLKHYYNNIKRKLHITLDPSSSSDLSSMTQNNVSTKEELLKDIKQEFQLDKRRKVVPNINNYKSQSKALQQLVSYIKLNSRFEQIKTLKTEDCFNEQQMFEETAKKKQNAQFLFDQSVKSKPRIFKKICQHSSGRKTPISNISKGQKLSYRSKSIKPVKFKQIKQPIIETERYSKFSSPFRMNQQQILKQSRNNNSLNKRHSSLGKLNQPHYSSPVSPYKRKSLTKQKGKTTSSTSVQTKQNQPVQQIKLNNEQKSKLKESIMKIQMIKFQNQIVKIKTTPNSPSSKRMMKQNVQIIKNDNILSIRKKKLQILKEKAHKK